MHYLQKSILKYQLFLYWVRKKALFQNKIIFTDSFVSLE